jgi:hypothetical protein
MTRALLVMQSQSNIILLLVEAFKKKNATDVNQ